MWKLYILECADQTLYTGITTDIDRRLKEHNAGSQGAKYTRARRPVRLAYCRAFRSRERAAQAECRIKSWPRSKKLEIIAKKCQNLRRSK